MQILVHSSFHSVSLEESEVSRKILVSSMMVFNLEGHQTVLYMWGLEKVSGHIVSFLPRA